METNLLPCPFCGSEAETKASRYEPIELTLWSVRCKPRRYDGKQTGWCVASSSLVMYATEAEAIEAWNTRQERTCRNISDPPEGFLCSECKWGDFDEPSHLLTSACFAGGGILNYCPNCGCRVEVVQDAD